MANFGTTVLAVGGGAFAMAGAYLVVRISDTWDKRNTDAMVQWAGISLVVLIMAIILVGAFFVLARILLRAKQDREDVLDGNWARSPMVMSAPRHQEPMYLPEPQQQPMGQMRYAQEVPNAYAYAQAAPPPPPPMGQMQRGTVHFDMGNGDW